MINKTIYYYMNFCPNYKQSTEAGKPLKMGANYAER
jgi:hypothetical protein